MARQFRSDGFLGDDLSSIASQVHGRYGAHVELFDRANALAWERQYDLEVDRNSALEVFSAAYYGRVLMLVQATVLCLERGITPAGKIVLRSATETLFTLGALARRPERIERIIADTEIRKRDMLKRIKLFADPSISTVVVDSVESSRLERLLATEGAVLSAYSLAEDAGLRDWYSTIYSRLCWSVHAAANDVEDHILTVDGELQELRNEPEVEGQEYLWMVCTNLCILAMQFASEVFALDIAIVESLNRDFEALYDPQTK